MREGGGRTWRTRRNNVVQDPVSQSQEVDSRAPLDAIQKPISLAFLQTLKHQCTPSDPSQWVESGLYPSLLPSRSCKTSMSTTKGNVTHPRASSSMHVSSRMVRSWSPYTSHIWSKCRTQQRGGTRSMYETCGWRRNGVWRKFWSIIISLYG